MFYLSGLIGSYIYGALLANVQPVKPLVLICECLLYLIFECFTVSKPERQPEALFVRCYFRYRDGSLPEVAWENSRDFATPPTVSLWNDEWMSLTRSGQCFWLAEAYFQPISIWKDDKWLRVTALSFQHWKMCDIWLCAQNGVSRGCHLFNTDFNLSIKILTHRSLWCIACWRVLLVPST